MDYLPTRRGDAHGQMAADALMLFHYPRPGRTRFRHYGWEGRHATFGYAQKWSEVTFGRGADFDQFCRRPTGGGLVDHRNDWTYCLVVPPEHPLARSGLALDAYQRIHRAVVRALNAVGMPAALQPVPEGRRHKAEACFAQAEPHDVVHPGNGRKIAGAAMKRNHEHGLLIQGSIDRGACPGALGADFHAAMVRAMAELTESAPEATPWPEWPAEAERRLREQYASEDWNRRR